MRIQPTVRVKSQRIFEESLVGADGKKACRYDGLVAMLAFIIELLRESVVSLRRE